MVISPWHWSGGHLRLPSRLPDPVASCEAYLSEAYSHLGPSVPDGGSSSVKLASVLWSCMDPHGCRLVVISGLLFPPTQLLGLLIIQMFRGQNASLPPTDAHVTQQPCLQCI